MLLLAKSEDIAVFLSSLTQGGKMLVFHTFSGETICEFIIFFNGYEQSLM